MKKHFILFIATISASFFVGCSDSDDFTPPNYVTFETQEMNVAVEQTTSESFDVTIFTANTTGSDRTFDLNVLEESTLDPSSYTLPETITVPANSNEATVTLDITGAGIDNAGDVLVLGLGNRQGLFTGDPLTVNVGKICVFDPVGDFVNNSWFFEEEVPAEIIAGASENQYVAPSLFSGGVDINFTVNPDLTITIPTQVGWVHPSYGDVSVEGRAGSEVSPCTGTVVLRLNHFVSAGSFGTGSEVLTKIETTGDGGDTDGEDTDGEDTDNGE